MAGQILRPVLAFVSTRRRFGLTDAVKATGLARRPVLRVLDRLTAQGYLVITKEDVEPRDGRKVYGKDLRAPRYEVIKDVSQHKGLKKSNTCRDQIWRTVRNLRRFTRTDLARLTDCAPSAIEDYTRLLARHEIIRAVGKRSRETLYILPTDPGPTRPETPQAGPEKET